MFLISALAALALAGADAAPAGSAATASEKPAAASKPKTKKVCTTSNVTGGRLAHKHCVTVKVPDEEPSASAPDGQTAEAAKS